MSFTVYADPDDEIGEYVNAKTFTVTDGVVIFHDGEKAHPKPDEVQAVYTISNIYMFE